MGRDDNALALCGLAAHFRAIGVSQKQSAPSLRLTAPFMFDEYLLAWALDLARPSRDFFSLGCISNIWQCQVVRLKAQRIESIR
jgi:hypothetical protein